MESLSSSSVFSAPLWFVKKSDHLQNLQRAITLFLCVLCGLLKRAIACKISSVQLLPFFLCVLCASVVR
ncbi:hypothetical protein [uncultured Nostoc sp.]|uniref:hypothetical protein n=1 Tax=uncultured Nostoc sp. TaxID=340711 RepID=UPI0035CB6E16